MSTKQIKMMILSIVLISRSSRSSKMYKANNNLINWMIYLILGIQTLPKITRVIFSNNKPKHQNLSMNQCLGQIIKLIPIYTKTKLVKSQNLFSKVMITRLKIA